jgi:transcriptional activator SPT7
MKQKADHHLEFLADKTVRSAVQPIQFLSSDRSLSSRQLAAAASTSSLPAQPSPLRGNLQLPGAGGDEDAAGESDDEVGDDSFRSEAEAGPWIKTVAPEAGPSRDAIANGTSSKWDDRHVR